MSMAVSWPTIGRSGSGALISAIALVLAGCSTIQDMGGIPRPGYQKDGSYVLSSQEQELGCRELQERSLGLQHQLQALPVQAVAQMQQVPDTIAAAWGRLFGSPGAGVPALAEYSEVRAESAALNDSLAKKGCDPIETATVERR